jgi:1-deoxy-D-xylulose-5-phosphate reductoisomerase
MKKIAILGSTGSIGTQAVNVVRRYPDRLTIIALAVGNNIQLLDSQIREFSPLVVSVHGPSEASALSDLISDLERKPEILYGTDGLTAISSIDNVDSILNGVVGSVGFLPTLTALEAGREVLLANKESLVMAGDLIRGLLDSGNGKIIPVDSEHSAIYQCLDGKSHTNLSRIILTGSGGPFRTLPKEQFKNITLEQALNHPTWKMGPKITIDSATMMNKGLEIIEACYLFNLPPDKIDVVIHPSSIIHSFVEFDDGCMLAQLSYPTMEVPIQYALLSGERMPTDVRPLDLEEIGSFEFFKPDYEKFPALQLARQALEKGGTSPAVLNASNEEAVQLFLENKIAFTDIAELVRSALEISHDHPPSVDGILEADSLAREHVKNMAVSK